MLHFSNRKGLGMQQRISLDHLTLDEAMMRGYEPNDDAICGECHVGIHDDAHITHGRCFHCDGCTAQCDCTVVVS